MNHVFDEAGEALSGVDATHMVGDGGQQQRFAFAQYQGAFEKNRHRPDLTAATELVRSWNRFAVVMGLDQVDTRVPVDRCDQYFGGCPRCGQSLFLNVGRNHYGTCPDHKVFWDIGSNLFSSWREETEDQWAKNRAVLRTYREVEPLPEGAVIPEPAEVCHA